MFFCLSLTIGTVLHKKIGLTMMNIRKFNRTKKGEYAKMELKVIELVY